MSLICGRDLWRYIHTCICLPRDSLKSWRRILGLMVVVTLIIFLFNLKMLNFGNDKEHQRLKPASSGYTGKTKSTARCNQVTPHRVKMNCEKWVVVTTIFNLTDAVKDLLKMPKWCMVLVGDKKGPKEVPSFPNLIFLDVAWQERCPYHICQHIPWNHFSRKNIGFMYAVANGAKWIYDTDDDNFPKFPKAEPLLDSSIRFDLIQVPGHVYNPYIPYIKPNTTFWPRGLPLDKIKDSDTKNMKVIGTVKPEKVAVINYLAQTDPDVDAIYRLTQKIPFQFEMVEKYYALPHYIMSPYNAQATMHAQFAFWGLLLPASVDMRVTDIWRSYFTQRLVWDTDGHIAFGPPYVNQIRNAHSYMVDFHNEMDVYLKTSRLIKFLVNWIPKTVSLAQNMIDLYIELYQIDIIGRADIDLAIAWIRDLECVGYTFPPVKVAKDYVYLIQGASVTMLDQLVSNSNRDVLWLTYETESGDLYRPNSTWTSGRNLQLEHAVERGSRMSEKGYKYFIFLDDDAKLSFNTNGRRWKDEGGCNSDVVWTCFEQFLGAHEPAVSYPFYTYTGHFYDKNSMVNTNYHIDPMMVAFHRDTLSFLLPYSTEFEAQSWWASGVICAGLANMLYSTNKFQFNVLHSINLRPNHPGNTKYKTDRNQPGQLQFLLSALLPTVDGKPNPLLNSTSPRLAPRINGKPNLKKNKTYIVDYAFIKKYFKLDHKFSQSRLNWLKNPVIKRILFGGKDVTEFDNSFNPDYSYPI
ncbi:uncharacterized protein LOC135489234 [Lineus longissimus]|uniref:uncharacterized protein LOC135489234 n=1 Tax=Lineus longissimus TaxID=88925 RepID=UPI002B4D4F2A